MRSRLAMAFEACMIPVHFWVAAIGDQAMTTHVNIINHLCQFIRCWANALPFKFSHILTNSSRAHP